MKIYLISKNIALTKAQTEKLKSFGELILIDTSNLSAQDVINKAADADILIAGNSGITKIQDDLLAGLPKLKYISLLSVGTDWVDLDAVKKRNIPISNIKGAYAESVAEHTWGMMLDLSKKISEFATAARQKGAYDPGFYRGREVYGKTIGIIGLGDIGKRVARIAKGFGMRILGVNKSGKRVKGIELVSINKLLAESDIVTICAPLNKETEGFIDGEKIASMKNNAILVNCVRSEIVDKKAVLKAIKEKKLFGYGVETKNMQPIPKDDEYFKYKNVLLTPHNAFNTTEAVEESFDIAIANVEAFLSGKPQNLVV